MSDEINLVASWAAGHATVASLVGVTIQKISITDATAFVLAGPRKSLPTRDELFDTLVCTMAGYAAIAISGLGRVRGCEHDIWRARQIERQINKISGEELDILTEEAYRRASQLLVTNLQAFQAVVSTLLVEPEMSGERLAEVLANAASA